MKKTLTFKKGFRVKDIEEQLVFGFSVDEVVDLTKNQKVLESIKFSSDGDKFEITFEFEDRHWSRVLEAIHL